MDSDKREKAPNGVMSLPSTVERLHVYASRNEHVQHSLDTVEECLKRCADTGLRYCVSFNGGKDCTVLLHLLSSVLKSRGVEEEIPTLYIKIPDMFPELEEFVQRSVERYRLRLIEFEGPDYKKALEELKRRQSEKGLEYIMMGTRATDLSRPLSVFQKTDQGWPQFTRVNPLLNWSYSQIWAFLRDLEVPYCSLYDKGYTSLGSRSNTRLNPKLEVRTPHGDVTYLPAYMLKDCDQERSGRSTTRS
jgi:FAD synthetase